MRKESTSASKRAPSGVAVPVLRATGPSTASRANAMMASVTSAVVDTDRSKESATSPATPALSSARVSVIQSAGKIAGFSLRSRATASSAVATQPTTNPTSQPRMPRPAAEVSMPSSAGVASAPRMTASRIVRTRDLHFRPPLHSEMEYGSVVGPVHRGRRRRRSACPIRTTEPSACLAPYTPLWRRRYPSRSWASVRSVRRFGRRLLRVAGAMTVLVFVAPQVGAAPFQDGLRVAGAGMVGLSPR